MINSTQVSYLIFDGYIDVGHFKYLCFLLILCLYLLVIGSNVLLIAVICLNKSLHEPMYLFLCSLFVNELFCGSGLIPFLMVQVLSDVHTVSVPFCFVQTFFLYFFGCVEFYTLSIMSYDRYVAICYPLQYSTIMTFKKVVMLIAVIRIPPAVAVLGTLLLTSSLQLCRNTIDKIHCDNYTVVKLACSDTTVVNVYALISVVFTICLPVCLILFSYIRILIVCFSGSNQNRQKAVSTCTPHLISLMNFCFWGFFDIALNNFDANNLIFDLTSASVLTCHPLFSPLLYGLHYSKIRLSCKDLLLSFGEVLRNKRNNKCLLVYCCLFLCHFHIAMSVMSKYSNFSTKSKAYCP